MEKPSKPKDNLLVQIAKEAIARTEKKIAAIQAILDDNPFSEMNDIDEKINNLTTSYRNVKTHKQLEKIAGDIKDLQLKRADCWRRFEKQKDIGKLFDKKYALENEKEKYEKAVFHFSLWSDNYFLDSYVSSSKDENTNIF